MISPEIKDLVQVISQVCSPLIATGAVVIAHRLGRLQREIQEGQRRIQQAQLRSALHDRRFKVFEDSIQFMLHLMSTAGATPPRVFGDFVTVIDRAELLFNKEVPDFLSQLRGKGIDMMSDYLDARGNGFESEEAAGKFTFLQADCGIFAAKIPQQLKDVFRPYLELKDDLDL